MSSGIEAELRNAGGALRGFELVPGLPVEEPEFGPAWGADELAVLRDLVGRVPEVFAAFLRDVGGISAINVGGGFASMSLTAIRQELSLEYADALTRLKDGDTMLDVLPIGTNGSGSYFLLACDDRGVWKFNVHMRPIARPVKVADSTRDFLSKLAEEWRAMADGEGAPYMTS